jgi:hypothetical protein
MKVFMSVHLLCRVIHNFNICINFRVYFCFKVPDIIGLYVVTHSGLLYWL